MMKVGTIVDYNSRQGNQGNSRYPHVHIHGTGKIIDIIESRCPCGNCSQYVISNEDKTIINDNELYFNITQLSINREVIIDSILEHK